MFSPSIIESVKDPKNKEIPDVFWRKLSLEVDEGGGHAKRHAAIISPYPYSTMSCLKQSTFNRIDDIFEPFFNDLQPFRIVRYKLCTRSQCITDAKSQQRSNASFSFFVLDGKVLGLETICIFHLLKNFTVEPTGLIMEMDDAHSIEQISRNLLMFEHVVWQLIEGKVGEELFVRF